MITMKSKKKIIIDLDVVTVAKWDKGKNGDLGRSFIIKRNVIDMLMMFGIKMLMSLTAIIVQDGLRFPNLKKI